MNRILIASVFALGFVGAAAAQQAPYTVGNYSDSVLQSLNPASDPATPSQRQATAPANVDRSTTASIDSNNPVRNDASINDLYSGR